MKELTTYNRTVQYLNKVFKLINSEYFDNELEMPTITIQSTVGAYGHVTTSKVWKTEAGKENIVATLIHEGCHLYAMQNDIKDTSNNGVYHNGKFKKLAEERGLDVARHDKYGWTITHPTDETIRFCIDNDLPEIMVTRNTALTFVGIGTGKNGDGLPVKPVTPKKGNSIKWICPCCGAIVRSTKILNINCGDCNTAFIIV